MIPRIGKGGGSFVAAVQYYAHDKAVDEDGKPGKGMAATSERVDWVVADNLQINTELGSKSEQIEAMKKCALIQQWTAEHQKDIKLAAGGSAAGRPLAKPAYTYSLSWAPGEDISRAEMLRAARSSLKVLGMDKHQALIVAHNDGPTHVHCIVNRVDAKTGKAASLSCDRLKLSKWAEKYERKRGQILVPSRVENNKKRVANKQSFNRLRSRGDGKKIVKGESLTREEWGTVKRYKKMDGKAIRADRAAAQEAQADQLQKRHDRRTRLIDDELGKVYGGRKKALRNEIRVINERIGAAGWFRQALRKVTGHHQRDIRAVHNLKASLASLDGRVNEKRGQIMAEIGREKHMMSERHKAELARDEKLIALAEKSKGKAEGRKRKAKAKSKGKSLCEAQEKAASSGTGKSAGRGTRGQSRTPDRKRDRSEQRKQSRAEKLAKLSRGQSRGKDQGQGLGD